MLKSTLIAHCLVNLRSGITLEQGEHIVRQTFDEEYPRDNFDHWNTDIPDRQAELMIDQVGNPSWVRVDLMIRDLW